MDSMLGRHKIWGPIEVSDTSSETPLPTDQRCYNSFRRELAQVRKDMRGSSSQLELWDVDAAIAACNPQEKSVVAPSPPCATPLVYTSGDDAEEKEEEFYMPKRAKDAAVNPETEGGSLPSVGSAAHAMGTCRPCHYAHTKNGCEKGMCCGFCHFKHQKRNKMPPHLSMRPRHGEV